MKLRIIQRHLDGKYQIQEEHTTRTGNATFWCNVDEDAYEDFDSAEREVWRLQKVHRDIADPNVIKEYDSD